jgi:gluconolactonase
VVGEYNGKRIDGPNDMVLDSRGGFYFTDSQFIGKQEKMQDKSAVYYVKTDGTVIRVVDDVAFPNGVALSPDGKVLYLANTQGKYLLAYNVRPDGTLANRRNFAVLELSKENIAKKSEMSGADGVAVDSAGNVYVATTQGLGVQVCDKGGKRLGNILCPAPTNNCAFGGPDMKTLYVSAKDGIYRIPIKTAGFRNE